MFTVHGEFPVVSLPNFIEELTCKHSNLKKLFNYIIIQFNCSALVVVIVHRKKHFLAQEKFFKK